MHQKDEFLASHTKTKDLRKRFQQVMKRFDEKFIADLFLIGGLKAIHRIVRLFPQQWDSAGSKVALDNVHKKLTSEGDTAMLKKFCDMI